MPFRTFKLRGERVLARVDDAGAPVPGPDGRVEILYKPGGKLYRAGARNLEPDPGGRSYTDGEAENLRVTVADKGPGISPELAKRLGRVFVTTKPPETGNGIGLFLTNVTVSSPVFAPLSVLK